MRLHSISLLLGLAATAICANAQNPVRVHGSLQCDALFPETDYTIGTGEYSDVFLTNTYATAGVYSKYVDGGLRFEYLEHPMPGFEPAFQGWGIPNIYVKGKYHGVELTVGDFYEQFGSGMILRTYEDRALGIDNSIRGGRVQVNTIRGLRFTALAGSQRVFWDWNTKSHGWLGAHGLDFGRSASMVYGANLEWDANEYIKSLTKQNIIWTFAASYVLKHQDDEKITSGTDFILRLPHGVSAFDVRTHFNCSGLDLNLEYAWKGQDPSFDNHYTYGHGSAILASVSYSKPGWSAFIQAKRSDNMSMRSRRSQSLTGAFINNLPPFAYQHTYTLAAMYPYATQMAPGEWALQGSFAYNFKRGTKLGGKYGTKVKLNASYICGIDRAVLPGNLAGTDWYVPDTEGLGDTYYTDINLQVDKKLTKDLQLNLMYMFQKYNKTVIEGHGGMINSNIFVAEGKYKVNKKVTVRGELQYLQTRDDQKDWCYALAEVSVLPYLMFTVSDQWNHGGRHLDKNEYVGAGEHYYLASVTGSFRGCRLMVGYGRTRAGFNCSGGVCRYVPATRGLQMALTYNF